MATILQELGKGDLQVEKLADVLEIWLASVEDVGQ